MKHRLLLLCLTSQSSNPIDRYYDKENKNLFYLHKSVHRKLIHEYLFLLTAVTSHCHLPPIPPAPILPPPLTIQCKSRKTDLCSWAKLKAEIIQ